MAAPLAGLALSTAVGLAKNLLGQAADAVQPSAAKAKKAAQEFEAMFLEQMLERVFASAGEEGPLGENGTGGEVYRSMLVKEYAGGLAKAGGVGIADQVYREMLKLQENAHASRP